MSQYAPKVDENALTIPKAYKEKVEALAEHVHDLWAFKRIKDGWTYGHKRDDIRKETPNLVPYAVLPELEKSYDRDIVTYILNQLDSIDKPHSFISGSAIEEIKSRLEQVPYQSQLAQFNIHDQLEAMRQAHALKLYEAVILYAGRIFEQLAGLLLTQVLHQNHENLAVTLGQLSALGLISPRVNHRAQAFRKLANAARHGRQINSHDACNVITLLDSIFDWFFSLFKLKSRQSLLSSEPLHGDLQRYIALQDLAGQDANKALLYLEDILESSVSSSLNFEFLIMKGLCLSRVNHLDASISLLETVYAQFNLERRLDDDLLGILAGAHKRQWKRYWTEVTPPGINAKTTVELRRALKYYKRAYQQSRSNNTYAGINLAAIYAWLGKEEEAILVADEVQKRVPGIENLNLQERFPGAPNNAGLWAVFTLAEAKLLIGLLRRSAIHIVAAEELYSMGIRQGLRFNLQADCESAISQMKFHLQILQSSESTKALVRLEKLSLDLD